MLKDKIPELDEYNNSDLKNKEFGSSKTNSNKDKENKDKKKGDYNKFHELDKNTSLIYWEDELSIFDNLEFKNDNLSNQFLTNCENDRMLIINVKNNLLFIDINSFECVIIIINKIF